MADRPAARNRDDRYRSQLPERETRYIPVTETAKLIRQALKEAFPEIKFSVRTDKYAGGSSIDVSWTDGPSPKLVEPIAETFQGGYFDGMTDYKGGRVHEFRGEEVKFGGDFVFCRRAISKPISDKAVAMLKPLSADDLEQMAFRFDVWRSFNKKHDDANRLAWLITHNAPTPQFEGRASKLAAEPKLIRSY